MLWMRNIVRRNTQVSVIFEILTFHTQSSLSKSNPEHFLKNKKVILSKALDVEKHDNIWIESNGEAFTKEIYETQKYTSYTKLRY